MLKTTILSFSLSIPWSIPLFQTKLFIEFKWLCFGAFRGQGINFHFSGHNRIEAKEVQVYILGDRNGFPWYEGKKIQHPVCKVISNSMSQSN